MSERVLKMLLYSCETFNHDPDHANANHRGAMIWANFIVTAQSSRFVQPAESSFHDPSFRQHLETFDSIKTPDDLQSQLAQKMKLLNPLNWCTQLPAVGLEDLSASAPMARQISTR